MCWLEGVQRITDKLGRGTAPKCHLRCPTDILCYCSEARGSRHTAVTNLTTLCTRPPKRRVNDRTFTLGHGSTEFSVLGGYIVGVTILVNRMCSPLLLHCCLLYIIMY